MNTLNSGKPSSFKDTPRKRIARLFLIIVISIVAGTLVIQYATLPIRSHIEFQPLLERARTIMDGTADPTPSEELDGELIFGAGIVDVMHILMHLMLKLNQLK